MKLALERSLKDLQVDYLDLYLMHYPTAITFEPMEVQYPKVWTNKGENHVEEDPVPVAETWKAMEGFVKQGLIKSLGVSNFTISLLRDLWNSSTIKPASIQTELHPYFSCKTLLRFCA